MRHTGKIAVCLIIGMFLGSVSIADTQLVGKQPTVETVPDVEAGTCSDQDQSQIVYSSLTASVLQDYGLDIREGIWRCIRLRTPWLQMGKVFSLQSISAQVDTGENITILSLEREPRLWVIPVSSGMVGYPNMPDEIHNRAAFNALLAENDIRPQTPEMWTSLAMLYLNMVGIEMHVADWKAHGETIHGLSSSPNFFHKKSLLPTVECAGEQCTVIINDTRGTSVTQKLTTWALTFTTTKKQAPRLDGVEQEVKPLSKFS